MINGTEQYVCIFIQQQSPILKWEMSIFPIFNEKRNVFM